LLSAQAVILTVTAVTSEAFEGENITDKKIAVRVEQVANELARSRKHCGADCYERQQDELGF
jgi:hypothetical protein